PLWFAPKTAFSGIESGYSKDERWLGFIEEEQKNIALAAMSKMFHDSIGRLGNTIPGEGSDTYIQRVWKEWNEPAGIELLYLSEQVLKPLLDNRQDAKALKN
ncbi:MAG: hypothetical protein ACTJHE_10260, partial [Vibrio casei]